MENNPPAQNSVNSFQSFEENLHGCTTHLTNFDMHSSLNRNDPTFSTLSSTPRLSYAAQLFPAGGDALYNVSFHLIFIH